MLKSIKWRFIITILVVLAALFFSAPSVLKELPSWWKDKLPSDSISLGLDLKGGVHLILEVQTEKAIESSVEWITTELKEALQKNDIEVSSIERKGAKIYIALKNPSDEERIAKLLEDEYPAMEKGGSEITEGAAKLTISYTHKEEAAIATNAINQALETIRNRIDQFGVSEPIIQTQGGDRILVQLPGIKDPQRAINLIGQTALLEFKLVDSEAMEKIDLISIVENAKKESNLPDDASIEDLNTALTGKIPEGDMVVFQRNIDRDTRKVTKVPYLLKAKTLMAGSALKTARVSLGGQFNEPHVAFQLNPAGAKVFEQITGENIGKHLAIILDNVVKSAPVIKSKISGEGIIEGNFTIDSASDLALVLRSGSLPAPVKILEKITVGPSLGQDSIQQGIKSILIGGALVALFMLIYYQGSGLIANFVLMLNIIIIIATMSIFRATLTLPGLAGVLLTIGMAVDANVLIFERIREELRLGKTVRTAVDAGFSRAFLTIFDSNLTTLIAAIVLFQFGTGPVKGFGITLSIGLIASMFTAVFVARLVFDIILKKQTVRKLSI